MLEPAAWSDYRLSQIDKYTQVNQHHVNTQHCDKRVYCCKYPLKTLHQCCGISMISLFIKCVIEIYSNFQACNIANLLKFSSVLTSVKIM